MTTGNTICIYHGNCADGFTSAWAVWKALGDEVEYVAGVYGQTPPDVTGKNVIMVDFSYKRPVLEEMAKRAHSVLILDHHKSAAEDLDGFPPPIAQTGWEYHLADVTGLVNDGTDPHLPRALFDMDRSGAGITWDYFHPNTRRPNLVSYVEDRDLWRFNLTASREVNAYIFAHEYTFDHWDWLHTAMKDHMGVQSVADMGGAIEKKHHKDVAELVATCRRTMVIGGHTVPVANIPYTLTSDAGHLMCQPTPNDNFADVPFAACYWDTPDGRVFSLRSLIGGADVSSIAVGYGGGGHKNAAGFKMPVGWEGE